jgi:hypothetical protein
MLPAVSRPSEALWPRLLPATCSQPAQGTLAISVTCPSNEPDLILGSKTARSPFVIAIKLAGIKTLPSIVNACFVTSAVSAGSSDLYTSSRALCKSCTRAPGEKTRKC